MPRNTSSRIARLALLFAGIPATHGAEAPWRRDRDRLPAPTAAEKQPVREDWLVKTVERKAQVFKGDRDDEIVLSNGLISRTFRLAPNAATVGFDHLVTGESVIRGVKPEAIVEIDGVPYEVGGLKGQPNYAFLRPEWIEQLEADPRAFQFIGFEVGKPKERFPWKRVRHHAPDAKWPPEGAYLRMDYAMPTVSARQLPGGAGLPSDLGRKRLIHDEFETPAEPDAELRARQRIGVSVHYELYDGVPILSKWITVHNGADRTIVVDRFVSEILPAVESESRVEERDVPGMPPNIDVETDYSMGGLSRTNALRFSARWVPDPDYSTQVSYLRQTPCLLEVTPAIGPEQDVKPGETFESYRAFLLPQDSYDRERQGLGLRRMYRTVAPWVTENPLMMHVRYADWDSVKNAIDQCAEVGFEMMILTFGSGFDIEDESPQYMAEMKRYADYARSKGIEIGGYSLLSSRRVEPDSDNCINPKTGEPGGTTHGNCPALAGGWGQDYFRKLYKFFGKTGFMNLEHDGSYPGDLDAASRPPLQKGVEDSQWVQWKIITDFYKWCRGRGVYLNVPDCYYLSGSSKCGMGYREVNWSLPRDEQVIHTRQNIHDGTWEKTPSMGWMFVPLTEYHGGGAAATIEPLHEHLDHYEGMLASNLGAGVQACYRGPRLYDTDETKAAVKKWVDFFKRHREALEGDLIHLRRADGRDVDYWLKVNPRGKEKGLLAVYNPLEREVSKTLRIPLYYTGLTDAARVSERDGQAKEYRLARDYTIQLPVTVPAGGLAWCVIE
jgi:hypothetical protein